MPLVGWQDGDTTRSTLDIIQTCVATILACTWSIQHLNVPAARDSEARRLLRACKHMLVTVLLPEFILAHAIFEFVLALECMDRMGVLTPIDVVYPSWLARLRKIIPKPRVNLPDPSGAFHQGQEEQQESSRASAHHSSASSQKTASSQHSTPGQHAASSQRQHSVVSQRSVASQHSGPSRHSFDLEKATPRGSPHVWTLTHAYFANMGGFVYKRPEHWPLPAHQDPSNTPTLHPLPGSQLALYMDWFDYPGIPERAIKDKSKTDSFAKAFAILQISVLVLSLIARRAQGLPSSQIEILTLAFAVCGVITYAIYWYKPKDVSVPIQLEPKSEIRLSPTSPPGPVSEFDVIGFLKARPFDSFWKVATNDLDHQDALDRIPNDNIPTVAGDPQSTQHAATILLAVVSVAFGSLHAIAWNFEFASRTEATLWHVCTILTIALPPLGLLAIPLSQATWSQGNPRDFLHATVHILRELVWQLEDRSEKEEANGARRELDRVYDTDGGPLENARKLYKNILWPKGRYEHGPRLRQKMLDLIDQSPDLKLPKGYRQQLEQLFRLMDGHGSKKMVEGVARTNVYPRRSMPAAWNAWLVYMSMGLYCVARLILVAIGLSSLRAMPEAVYAATWAEFIPSL